MAYIGLTSNVFYQTKTKFLKLLGRELQAIVRIQGSMDKKKFIAVIFNLVASIYSKPLYKNFQRISQNDLQLEIQL